jgi:hypothetical protein
MEQGFDFLAAYTKTGRCRMRYRDMKTKEGREQYTKCTEVGKLSFALDTLREYLTPAMYKKIDKQIQSEYEREASKLAEIWEKEKAPIAEDVK